MITTNKFERNPFYVDAIRVTASNIYDVAQWCHGDVRSESGGPNETNEYVKVRVYRPMTERQTMAFIGDWVLYAGTGFKVYTHNAFEKSFTQVDEADYAQPSAPAPISDEPSLQEQDLPSDTADSIAPKFSTPETPVENLRIN